MADADTEALKQMVMSFRVSELQVLLGFAGRNKSGRKQELLQRAVVLVHKGCSQPVANKIRELYKQIYASNGRRRLDASGNLTIGDNLPPAPTMVNPGLVAPIHGALTPCFEDYYSSSGALDYSSKSLAVVNAQPVHGLPVHPDVRLKRLPFYDILGDLLKPTSLMPKNNSRFQESYFVFHLTPQQAQDIAMSRDFRPGTKIEYTVQVQLRFCLLETSCEQDDNFPPSICVRVNSKMAQLPKPLESRPGEPIRYESQPLDLSPYVKFSPTETNTVAVEWLPDRIDRGYCLGVYLVRRLSSDILLQRLKQFGNRHPDHTRALIKEKLAHDPDSEVATTSLRVSLMCPLGKMRITIPCRASTCTHLQCFDASTFLMMNEKKPTWICPVCDKPAPFDKLIIDGYFVEICKQSPETNEIVFHEDGSWTPLKEKKDSACVIASPAVPAKTTTASVAPTTTSLLTAATHASSSGAAGGKKADVIDLTLDSSDEDDDVKHTDFCNPVTIMSGPSHLSEASNSSGCISPAVINLDAPSPALSIHSLSASGSPSPMVISPPSIPMAHSPYPSPTPSTSTILTPPPAHSYQPPPPMAHRNPAVSVYHQPLGGPPPPPLMVGTAASNNLGMPPINLESLSEAEFEEFLHGLSWGV